MTKTHSLALLTDLYQLTMAAGYLRAGLAERRAIFHLFFRRAPFGGGYAIAAGLEPALELLESLRFDASDLGFLSELRGPRGAPLFDASFLELLEGASLSLDVDAMPEGTPAFPHEPLLRVEGPLWQAQLVETALLNIVNFQTLIATKASRICRAARDANGAEQPVIEFGLRRAQGIDGALAASRAAYVGGCAGTSNVLAGARYGIPVRGTHAHSWVMSFPSEREAFEAYGEVFPDGCVFLVDTYDTMVGVRNAAEVGGRLRADGHELVGVRLDSGDLTRLSREARELLDEAGFPDATIVASNDLDEHAIAALKAAGATIDVWGVGTKLVTAHGQPALGGVYKLAALEDAEGALTPRVKRSEEAMKSSIPGRLQIRRYSRPSGACVADTIYDLGLGCGSRDRVGIESGETLGALEGELDHEDLLAPVMRGGERVGASPPLANIRDRAARELDRLSPRVLALRDVAPHSVGLEGELHRLRARLIAEAS